MSEGETGHLCEVESVDDLARAVQRLLAAGPEGRRDFGERGRARVREGHTLERMVADTLAVYEELA